MEENLIQITKVDEGIHKGQLAFEDLINENSKLQNCGFITLSCKLMENYLMLNLFRNSRAWSEI
jgi:hypothetical protein